MDEKQITRDRLHREWYERWRSIKWLGIATKNLIVFLGAIAFGIKMIVDFIAWIFPWSQK